MCDLNDDTSGYYIGLFNGWQDNVLLAWEVIFLWDLYRTGLAIALTIHSFDPCPVV